jgi:D-3-phosphoglycerate dehydrogenase
MVAAISELEHLFVDSGAEIVCPEFVQTLSEDELIELLPDFDGWIIGDDPATRAVFEAGASGRLRAAVKWGIGIDNVDFAAARELGLPIANTPQMFGREVADLAYCYLISLARETHAIHSGILDGRWPKPQGVSLADKTIGVVGFGDIGSNVARRAIASSMQVTAYDPNFRPVEDLPSVCARTWPEGLSECTFLVLTCALTRENHHMVNADTLGMAQDGVRIVNVARGPLIDEAALVSALESGKVHSAALDVFETEPLASDSPLRKFPRCVFGSHNASNTREAVVRASTRAVEILMGYLEDSQK